MLSMFVLPGGVEMVRGCRFGKMVIINVNECVVRKQGWVHCGIIYHMTISESGKYVVSVSDD